jgi:hypothetical protein
MTQFIALFLAPVSVIEAWHKTDPETRKPAEEKMRAEWGAWMGAHAAMIKDTAGAGKTKRIATDGISDVKNDIMLYSFVEAESHDAAAKAFANHPHLTIPQATIEVMEVRAMGPG